MSYTLEVMIKGQEYYYENVVSHGYDSDSRLKIRLEDSTSVRIFPKDLQLVSFNLDERDASDEEIEDAKAEEKQRLIDEAEWEIREAREVVSHPVKTIVPTKLRV